MFAILAIEREPLRWTDLYSGFYSWIQDAGGFAAAALFIWFLIDLFGPRSNDASRVVPEWQAWLLRAGLALSLICYLPVGVVDGFDVYNYLTLPEGTPPPANAIVALLRRTVPLFMTLGGAFSLLACFVPFLANVVDFRFRRISALARLSFKEAIRRRVLYAFSGFLLVLLFGSWFIPHKAEDEVRNYVWVVDSATWILLLAAAGVVAAFSIPSDIKNQTIHTIVTKPVERFEILMGRFLGFTALMTLVLFAMTTVGLMYVLRGVDPDAAAESLKAREPLYGELRFENTRDERKGINVGREWEYRTYITSPQLGTPGQREIARWEFPAVAEEAAKRPNIRCEYGFDIYRTTKGEENKGISCDFIFTTHNATKSGELEYQKLRREELNKPNRKSEQEIDDELSERFGYYEALSREVTDNHTQTLLIPGGFFRNALKDANSSEPAIFVRVGCNSRTQYVGMAKHDLYFRLDSTDAAAEKARFIWNYYKSAFGLWLRLCLVIGLCIALSTYFSGVIAGIVTLLLFLGGYCQEFIASVANGTNLGGGPGESMSKLITGQQATMPTEQTAFNKFLMGFDVVFRWFVRRLENLIPDIDRFDLKAYVAEGFNIGGDQLLIGFVMVVGYLLPWGLLAYYLIKWREIASAS